MRIQPSVWLFLAVVLAAMPANAQNPLAKSRDGEIVLGPFQHNESFEGVPVGIHVWVFPQFEVTDEALTIRVRIVGDLEDLQKKAGLLAERLLKSSDQCEEQKLDTLKYSLKTKSVRLRGRKDKAILDHSGDIKACYWFMNPVCSRLEDGWKPVIYACPNKISLGGGFTATVPVSLSTGNQLAPQVVFETPSIRLKGDVGKVATELLKLLRVDLGEEAQKLLQNVIKPVQLQEHLPDGLKALDPTFTDAHFLDHTGSLAAEIEMQVTLDRAALLQGVVQAIQ